MGDHKRESFARAILRIQNSLLLTAANFAAGNVGVGATELNRHFHPACTRSKLGLLTTARRVQVRNFFIGVIAILAAQLVLADVMLAQNRDSRKKKEEPPSNEPFNPHDLTAVWRFHGTQTPSSQMPPMTPWGQQRFDAAKPGLGPRGAPLGNDPMMICDPMGIPRILFY